MINGIKPSELDVRNRSLHIHYSNLTKIVNGIPPSISTFDRNFQSVIRRKKFNHIKWKHFMTNQEQAKLYKQNQIVKNKIIKIITSKPKLCTSAFDTPRSFCKSNYFYEKRRLQTSIDRENPEIAKRILTTNGDLSHKRDFTQFKKTRQFVRRLQRFPILKRLQNSVQSHRRRFKTEQKFDRMASSTSPKSMSRSMYFRQQR